MKRREIPAKKEKKIKTIETENNFIENQLCLEMNQEGGKLLRLEKLHVHSAGV
jgi:hypothetical protein